MGSLISLFLLPYVVTAISQAQPDPAGLDPISCSVAEGLEVVDAVKPGLIQHPMMAAFDDMGRLYVAESSGVNLKKEELLEKKPHSIRRLTDTDGDGIFDEVTLFADNMTFPQGALWIYDSLYVMSPPGLWCLEDLDGDGVAENREMLVEGFEFTGNAADVHGPFLHPNGRLYWCHGRKGHEVKDPRTGELVSKAKGARIWSCQIDGGDVRVHAGGGMDNPVEVDFTDTGEIIGSVNLFYGRPRGDVLVHWLHGGAYPRRDQGAVLEEFPRTGPLLPELHNFGHVAVSGMCRYRSGTLDEEWKDQWLVSHFNSNQVTRTKLARTGSAYEAVETETIFRLNRPYAHLTDVLEDRNGDLLVIDTGGWFRSGCPTSQLSRPEVSGGIYRIKKADKPYEAPEYRPLEKWDELNPGDVAQLLDAPETHVQERAITEFAVRGHSSIPEIRMILEDGKASATAKRNSIWALARMKFSDAPDLMHQALDDPDASVKIAACNALSVTRTWQSIVSNHPNEMRHELERNQRIGQTLGKLVRSADPEVARNAATALGAMAEARGIGSLIGRAGREDMDRSLRHAITYALIEMGDSVTVSEALRSGNDRQKAIALWALESMPEHELQVLDVIPHLESGNELLRGSAVDIIKRHPQWDAAIANQFYAFADELNELRRSLILELAPVFGDTPPILDFLGYLVNHESDPAAQLARDLLPRMGALAFRDDWENPLRAWLGDEESRLTALECLANIKTDRFDGDLDAIVENEKNPPLLRVRALQARAGGQGRLSPEAFDLLLSLISENELRSTQTGAAQLLSTAKLNADQRLRIAGVVDKAGPIELPLLLKSFRVLNEEQARVLAGSLPASPGFASLNMAEVRGLFSGFDEEIRKPVDLAVEKVEEEGRQKEARIEVLATALAEGDPERGKSLFESGKGACVTCHRIGETGKSLGPDLSRIAAIRKPVDLLESILFPSETIARDFDSYTITLNDDSTAIGLIMEESGESITLADVTGQTRVIERSEIRSLLRNEHSLMPQGLEGSMSETELLDLVSYLSTLR